MSDYAQSLITSLKARYKAYISIYNVPFDFTGADFTNPTVLNQRFIEATRTNETLIGAIQSLKIENQRHLNQWRELDYTTAGKPVETYPGLPSYDLTIDRLVLYESMIADAFYTDKDDSVDISKQTKPLLIKVVLEDPNTADKTSSEEIFTRTWFIYGVWLLDSTIDFGVDDVDDIKIVQSVPARAAGIVGDK
jgi:hypothetical protein